MLIRLSRSLSVNSQVLLLLPFGIGLCMAFADVYARWSKLLIWGSVCALLVGVLNSIRMSFVPTTLWMLGVYVGMIGIGGGLMFKGVEGSWRRATSKPSVTTAIRFRQC